MPHEIQERDIQAGVTQAWHNETLIVEEVTQEVAHPFEVVPSPCPAQYPGADGEWEDSPAQVGEDLWYRLIATDDQLPVGPPYNPKTYSPSSIALFWQIIAQARKIHPFEVASAGSVKNRTRIFASLRIEETYEVGGRVFSDFLNLLDGFDRDISLQARYGNVCVVCNNTFTRALSEGKSLGKVKHSGDMNEAAARIAESIEAFFSTASDTKKTLAQAYAHDCSEFEARCWLAGVDCAKKKKLSPSDVQRVARMTELFRHGKGNEGRNRLDAFQGLTEFHTHESGTRFSAAVKKIGQWLTSEFGSSADTKERAIQGLKSWESYVTKGHVLLKAVGALTGQEEPLPSPDSDSLPQS